MNTENQPLTLRQLDSLDSPLHQKLLTELDNLIAGLTRLVMDAEDVEDQETLKKQVWEAVDKHNYVMSGLQMFRASLEEEATNLDAKLELMEKKKDELLDERDELIEKGHELNCRIGYNALERKLEETFTDTEKYTTLESAKCFRDEAEEEQRRTNDLVRIGNMRACQIDRDLYNEMEKITDLFENYERDREHYVRELDLYSDVRRQRVSNWLAIGNCTDKERQTGEDMLDFLSLTEKKRHMDAQLIKSALRMYSFNASLHFDREDNQKLLDELTNVQCEVNAVSGLDIIVPRHATAKTDLTSEVQESTPVRYEEQEEGDTIHHHDQSGRGLHRCPRKYNLATDPITDVTLLARLEAALRWEEKDVESCGPIRSSLSDVQASSTSSQEEVRDVGPVCGVGPVCDVGPVCSVGPVCGDHSRNVAGDKIKLDTDRSDKERHETGCRDPEVGGSHSMVLANTERSTQSGVVRKKKSSLTNFSYSDIPVDGQEKQCRPQTSSEPISTIVGNGTKSRDVSGSDVRPRPVVGGNKQRELASGSRSRSSGNIVSWEKN